MGGFGWLFLRGGDGRRRWIRKGEFRGEVGCG